MSLVQRFKAWVAEQPPETTIDHESYDSCAMGVFARTLPELLNGDRIYGWDVAHSLSEIYGNEPYMIIGNGGRHKPRVYGDNDVPMATYGELSKWLNSLEPVAIAD